MFTQKLISKETVYKMLNLVWKITMSLSHYIAYEKKKTNAMKEKNRYTKYYNLHFTEKK